MSRLLSGWRALAGLASSAVLLGVYARGGWGFVLGFVALLPWLVSLAACPRLRGTLLSAWAMSIACVLTTFSWFASAIADYLALSPIVAMLVLVIAAPLLQPQFIIYAWARRIASRRLGPWMVAMVGASAWVATEWLWPKLLGDTIGHGLYPARWLRQFADVAGTAGLSFLLIAANEGIAMAWTRRRLSVREWVAPLAVALAIPLLLTGYGALRLSMLPSPKNADTPPLRIGMVQSNIIDYDRLRAEVGGYEVVRRVLDTHFSLSYPLAKTGQVDALLWSETIYPTTFGQAKSDDGAAFDREIIDFVDAAGVPLVFGTYDTDTAGEYNAAAFIAPGAPPLGFYRKTRLFLLTEYMPAWLERLGLRDALPWAGAWQKGSGARVMPLRLADGREVPVQVLICLDDVDPGLAIDGARLGAEALLGMSNDSWFTRHPLGAQLHLQVAAFRSIETRLPQLRVTTNGISAVLDATGQITASTGMNEQALLIGEVTAMPPPFTLMRAWGDWLGKAAGVFLMGLMIIASWSRWRARHPRPSRDDAALALPLRVAMMTPPWRVSIALLRMFSRIAVLWMIIAWWLGDAGQDRVLTQLRTFAWLVLLPEAMAWLIRRLHVARLVQASDGLSLIKRGQTFRLVGSALQPWALPLPDEGATVEVEGVGKRAIAGVDPGTLVRAMQARLGDDPRSLCALLMARARGLARRPWLDHPLIKFGLFPLLPALIAFRLHQVITFGGLFGEALNYGWGAWFTALGIWWVRWIVAMVLWAGALRLLMEAICLLFARSSPARAVAIRAGLETAARALYYLGVPLWLAWRIGMG